MAVKLSSPGPMLFRQRRIGQDGQVFEMLKFRSMQIARDDVEYVPPPSIAPGGVEGDGPAHARSGASCAAAGSTSCRS